MVDGMLTRNGSQVTVRQPYRCCYVFMLAYGRIFLVYLNVNKLTARADNRRFASELCSAQSRILPLDKPGRYSLAFPVPKKRKAYEDILPVIAAIYIQNLIISGSWPKNILRPSAVNNRNLTVANAVLTGTLCDPRT